MPKLPAKETDLLANGGKGLLIFASTGMLADDLYDGLTRGVNIGVVHGNFLVLWEGRIVLRGCLWR